MNKYYLNNSKNAVVGIGLRDREIVTFETLDVMEAQLQDLAKIAELLKKMLTVEPPERPTAKSLLTTAMMVMA